MTIKWINPNPEFHQNRWAIIGGTLSGYMASVQWQNIFSTFVLSLIGTIVSYYVSRGLNKFHEK